MHRVSPMESTAGREPPTAPMSLAPPHLQATTDKDPRHRWALHRRTCSLRRTTTPPRCRWASNRSDSHPADFVVTTHSWWTKSVCLLHNHNRKRYLSAVQHWTAMFGKSIKEVSELSFALIHKVGNVDTFVLLKFETKWDWEINQFNFNSEYQDKCKFDLKLSGT